MLSTLTRRLPIGWAARLALQRLAFQWRSLLTLIAGALLSAAVGALVPLYTAAVAQVGMVERLAQSPGSAINAHAEISLIASKTPDLSARLADADQQFTAITQSYLGSKFGAWASHVVFWGETSALDIDPAPVAAQPGADATVPDPTARAFVAFYEGWPSQVTLVSGRMPTDTPANPQADIEIVVPVAVQTTQAIALNDVLILDQGGPRGGWPSSKNVRALVVGIVNAPEQQTTLQRGYFMDPSPVRVSKGQSIYRAEFPVLTTRAAFERVAREFVPDTPTQFGWRVLFDHTRLPFTRSAEARQALFDYDHALVKQFPSTADRPFSYSTGLINWQTENGQQSDTGLLIRYEQSVQSLNAPFGLLLLQVGALVIFFLSITAALVRRGERREIAMLQSRGATDRQITLVRSAEALVICVLAALAAPFLARELLVLITPFFARYENLPLTLSPAVFGYAAAAAAVAFLALLFTLRPVLRQPLVTAGGTTTRAEQQPWWQRYYVDLVLVALGLSALWRLVGQQTPLFTTNEGGRTTDPFVLLAPALLFLGLGSILLRLFPVIAGLAAHVLAGRSGLIGPLASWQLSREPVHYGRITFLLALAIGIGWFAASFRATLTRSQTDQAQYRIGADIRLQEQDTRLNVPRARPLADYQAMPGVNGASVAWRQANVNFQSSASRPALAGDLLAIDALTFVQSSYWRADLGDLQVPRPARASRSLPDRGQPLPFVPRKLGVWALFRVPAAFGLPAPDVDRLQYRTQLSARMLDSAGTWLKVPFEIAELEYTGTGPQAPGVGGGGAFVTTGWAYLEADLGKLLDDGTAAKSGPMRLVSLYWQHRGRTQNGERDLRLTLAGFSGIDDKGQSHPLELLSNPGWEFAFDSGATSEGSLSEAGTAGPHGPALTAVWNQSAESATLGMLLNYPALPSVPMLASNSLMAQLDLQPGQVFSIRDLEKLVVPFQVIGSQHYYPTLYDALKVGGKWTADEQNHPFAVVDRDALLYALNRRPSAALYGSEVWLRLQSWTDPATVVETLQGHGAANNKQKPDQVSRAIVPVSIQTANAEVANLRTDPLSLGLLGLMFLAFIIATALSIVGLLTYSALTATARRSEFGVLRALGLPASAVIRQIALEQTFVIGVGVALGGILGTLLSQQVVPRLALDASSKTITPPFIVQAETAAIVQYAVLIGIVLVLVLALSMLLVRRMSLSQTLRLGEE